MPGIPPISGPTLLRESTINVSGVIHHLKDKHLLWDYDRASVLIDLCVGG